VPDLKKKPFALAGIMLDQEGVTIPKGIRTGTDGQTFETSYRAPVAGDPAVRPGETIAYGSTLFSSKDDLLTGEVQVLRDAMPVHSEPLVSNGPAIHGTYHIEKNGRAATQWIDFEVVKSPSNSLNASRCAL